MNTKANIDESVKDRFKAFADVIHELSMPRFLLSNMLFITKRKKDL